MISFFSLVARIQQNQISRTNFHSWFQIWNHQTNGFFILTDLFVLDAKQQFC